MAAPQLFERREYKYLLPAKVAEQVRQAAFSTCTLDPYAGPDGTYRIRSLYLDNRNRDLYWANEAEQGRRFKARIRNYPGKKSPVFLEIKRREYDVIVKNRTPVSRDIWATIDKNRMDLWSQIKGADEFIRLVYTYQLEPVCLVDYERVAFASTIDNYGRLTLDSYICCQPQQEWSLEADPKRWRLVDHPVQTWTQNPVCVLELKFETHAPSWMIALVQRFNLIRYSFSKYCYSVYSLSRENLPGAPVYDRAIRKGLR